MERAGVLFAAACLSACAATGEVAYRSPDLLEALPQRVAVLPFDNESLSFDAPDVLRRMVSERLGGAGPGVLSISEVDERLHEMGVTDGGQLGAFSPSEIGKALGVDGLLYGSVEEFVYQNVGFFRKREVRLRLRLVAAADGVRLWQDIGEDANIHITLSKKDAGRSFLEGVIEQAAEKLLKIPLQKEAERAVEDVLSKYPRR